MWKRFLNYIGCYTKDQYLSLDIDYSKSLAKVTELRRMIVDLDDRRSEQVVMNNKLPFQFDTLLEMYSEAQLNSFYYKMINHVRNNPKTRHLLDRWQKRLNDAKNTIKRSNNTSNSTNTSIVTEKQN